MKTLRDECERNWNNAKVVADGYAGPSALEVALGEYGSYRVVEGQLRYYLSTGQVYVVTDEYVEPHDKGVCIGNARKGDNVKLLLPPEEKELLAAGTWTVPTAKWKAERARADRYEKALRDIVDVRTEPLGVAQEMKRKAREALDENE